MSQQFNAVAREPVVQCLRFTMDMDLNELIAFVAGSMSVAVEMDGVKLYESRAYTDEFIDLEDDDILVKVFDSVEVFTVDEFDKHFKP